MVMADEIAVRKHCENVCAAFTWYMGIVIVNDSLAYEVILLAVSCCGGVEFCLHCFCEILLRQFFCDKVDQRPICTE